jgi:lipoprotein-releasing system ATP-binding protein
VTANLLQLIDAHKTFTRTGNTVRVLDGANVSIAQGDMISIVGASGAGKSTLLHILGTLDTPDAGEVRYGGLNLGTLTEGDLAEFRSKELGFVFQFHHLLPDFSALENVMMPAWIRREATSTARKKATDVLEEVGLAHRLSHRPAELSGGEQQRVALARALVMNPKLLLADEVTGNLDAKTADGIHKLLFALNQRRQVTLVVVTHNSAFAASMPRRLVLEGGLLKDDSLCA